MLLVQCSVTMKIEEVVAIGCETAATGIGKGTLE